jgi:hypothetical protein
MKPEALLQQSVVRVLSYTGLLFSATANGAFLQGDARSRAIRGRHLKNQGVSPGLPDILVFDPIRIPNTSIGPTQTPELLGFETYLGLAIELKAGKNKPTPEQARWHHRLAALGWKVAVCYSLDDAMSVLKACYPHKIRS